MMGISREISGYVAFMILQKSTAFGSTVTIYLISDWVADGPSASPLAAIRYLFLLGAEVRRQIPLNIMALDLMSRETILTTLPLFACGVFLNVIFT